jgi:hypothetical protein
MPSQAFRSFKYNLVDVDRLRQSHGLLHNGAQGRKRLGHITRSGVVMLCASWAHYCESLIREAAAYFSSELNGPLELPIQIQKEISSSVRASKHELKPLHLSGDGWKTVYRDHVNDKLAALHTPKSGILNDHFLKLLGIPQISSSWSLGENTLNVFVSVRGDIAHQGRHANYVTIGSLNVYRDQIRVFAVETDNFVSTFLKDAASKSHKPWNAIA